MLGLKENHVDQGRFTPPGLFNFVRKLTSEQTFKYFSASNNSCFHSLNVNKRPTHFYKHSVKKVQNNIVQNNRYKLHSVLPHLFLTYSIHTYIDEGLV
jgi:hypothetical protein